MPTCLKALWPLGTGAGGLSLQGRPFPFFPPPGLGQRHTHQPCSQAFACTLVHTHSCLHTEFMPAGSHTPQHLPPHTPAYLYPYVFTQALKQIHMFVSYKNHLNDYLQEAQRWMVAENRASLELVRECPPKGQGTQMLLCGGVRGAPPKSPTKPMGTQS